MLLSIRHSRSVGYACALLSLGIAPASAATPTTLIYDDFGSISQWADLSTAVSWGGHVGPTSAFEITPGGSTGSVVSLKTEALGNNRWDVGLRAFSALDYRFDTPLWHEDYILTIDFRAKWAQEETWPWGEGNRLVVFVTHDYPENGLDLTFEGELGSKVSDFSDHHWARPAYNLRIRGTSINNNNVWPRTSLMMYGGGDEIEGEFEVYTGPNGEQWWLPGFSPAPGGGSPGLAPAKGWVESIDGGLAKTDFHNYRYVITPDEQRLYFDANDDGLFDESELQAVQNLRSDPTNPFFNYFEHLEGIRLFWTGRNYGTVNYGQTLPMSMNDDVELDWIHVTKQLVPGARGDFNFDAVRDAADIDLLFEAIRTQNSDPKFDLAQTGEADQADVDFLLNLMGAVRGDSNLDGAVDDADLASLQAGLGTDSGWADGDFDGDGRTSLFDAYLLFQAYEASAPTAISIPEPASAALLAIGGVILSSRRRRML